jgi:hypothetical protein
MTSSTGWRVTEQGNQLDEPATGYQGEQHGIGQVIGVAALAYVVRYDGMRSTPTRLGLDEMPSKAEREVGLGAGIRQDKTKQRNLG